MNEQIQGVIKCGRGEGGFEYKGHYRAEIFFDRHGREFILDERQVLAARAELERELAAIEREKPAGADAEVERGARAARGKTRLHALKIGYLDEAGKPLVLTQKLYDYLREANGKALMFEPWDGRPRPAPAEETKLTEAERITRLEAGQGEIRSMMQQLLGELKKK